MKKLFILGIILTVLVSCKEGNTDCDVHFQNITEFQYKGHDYIWFHNGYNAGITHNPECKKCFEHFD